MAVKLKTKHLNGFVGEHELNAISPALYAAADTLKNGTGAGNDFTGWVDHPVNYDKEEYARIKAAAEKIKKSCDVFVVIGIGGSYLGARAAIEFVKSPLYNNMKKDTPDIYFAGNTISASATAELLEICRDRDVCINVISKSGTTTEPAIAFRLFRELIEKKYGEEGAKERIFITTDKCRGTLKAFADEKGYETFVVPDDIGGRYSVLTAVGLLPIAVSGADIDAMMKGAADARELMKNAPVEENPALAYAAYRNILYRKGKTTEILAAYEPSFAMMCEWWKQLYGESEGKDGKGIFPASVIFSTDLHSLGQYIQMGMRNLFETVVTFASSRDGIEVPYDPANIDGLNFLASKSLYYVNSMAEAGTVLAHVDGGVPNMMIEIDARDEYNYGYLVYFFEYACGVSGYLLGVNPFDQPGVEAYKKNMFALLGKPGYEEMQADLIERLNK